MTEQAADPREAGLASLLDHPEIRLSQDRLQALALVPDVTDHLGLERLQAVLFFELLAFVDNLIRSSNIETERDQGCVAQLPPEKGEAYSALLEQRSRLFSRLRALVDHANRGTLPLLRDYVLDAISWVTEQRISERLARKIFAAGMAEAKGGARPQLLREQVGVRRAPGECPGSQTVNADNADNAEDAEDTILASFSQTRP